MAIFSRKQWPLPQAVFNYFKNKEDIKTVLHGVPLGPATVTRRFESLSEDVDRQVLKDSLTLLHFKERIRGEDIYNDFKKNVSENDIPHS